MYKNLVFLIYLINYKKSKFIKRHSNSYIFRLIYIVQIYLYYFLYLYYSDINYVFFYGTKLLVYIAALLFSFKKFLSLFYFTLTQRHLLG